MSVIDTLKSLVNVKNSIRSAIKSKYGTDPGTDFSTYASKITSKDNLASLFRGQSTCAPISKAYTGKPISTGNMFYSNTGTSTDLTNLDVSQVTNMGGMFSDCTSLTSLGDLSNWDTSKVISMNNMFHNCTSLTSPGDLSKWDTSKVTNMDGMFHNCTSLTSIGDISNWDTSNVIMLPRFYNCASLTSIGDLSKWDTSKMAGSLNSMFSGCKSLTSLGDLSNWDTSKVTNMGYMFVNCKSISSFGDLSNWNTSKTKNMTYMFYSCKALTSLNASGWDLSSCSNISEIFKDDNKISNLILGEGWGKSPSALVLDLSVIASTLTDASWTSFKTMYDRASNGLPTMTIKFSTAQKTNYSDWTNFVDYMTNKGYTITVV